MYNVFTLHGEVVFMSEQTESHLTNPHDRFFRYFLGHPDRARMFIRHFLPAQVVAPLDLSGLQPVDASFVDPDLRSHQGDLLFQVPLVTGGEAYLYFLFEHKSYADPVVAWQLLRYMVRIWESMWKEGKELAPIVPVVLYHGLKPWQFPRNFGALLRAPEEIQPYTLDFSYILYDLNVVEDSQLQVDAFLTAGLLIMKYIHRPELREKLDELALLLGEVLSARSGIEAAVAVLRYMAEAGRYIHPEDLERVTAALPQGGEVMSAVTQKWFDEGLQKGLEQGVQQGLRQGLQQGLQQGRFEGMIQSLLTVLRARFAPPESQLEEVASRLRPRSDVKMLEKLHVIAVRVDSFDEFKAALEEMAP